MFENLLSSNFILYSISYLMIAADGMLLWRSEKNQILLVMNFFILYFDFSIIAGCYLYPSEYMMNIMMRLKSSEFGDIYLIGFYILFISTVVRCFCFFNPPKKDLSRIEREDNPRALIFLSVLILYLLFTFDRTRHETYTVAISAKYEYLKIIFLLFFIFSIKKRTEYLGIFLTSLCIIQDLLFGGRVTSLQLLLLLVFLCFSRFIKIKYLLFSIPGIFFMNILALYRINYSITLAAIKNAFFFINDTSTHAFHSGMTIIYAGFFSDWKIRIFVFFSNVLECFLGAGFLSSLLHDFSFSQCINLTQYATQYHWNVGGTFFPVVFFFIGGWAMTVAGLIAFWMFVRFIIFDDRILNGYLSILIVATLPRWYLYNPTQLFRCIFLFYILFRILSSFSKKRTAFGA